MNQKSAFTLFIAAMLFSMVTIVFIPVVIIGICVISFKIYLWWKMEKTYYLIVYQSHIPDFVSAFPSKSNIEITRIMHHYEYLCFDLGKAHVTYFLKSTLPHCIKVMNENGWQETIYNR